MKKRFIFLVVLLVVAIVFGITTYTSGDLTAQRDSEIPTSTSGGQQEKELLRDPSSLADREIFQIGANAPLSKINAAQPSTIIETTAGQQIELSAEIVYKDFNGRKIKMYGYNGMIPGPTLQAKQGSSILVNFTNNIDMPTTIHWHGLRHDIKDDGVPGVSQEPVEPGDSFLYTLLFPDEGIYWYHPHVREDIQQEGGLAGNMLVIPKEPAYYNEVSKEELLVLDDLFMGEAGLQPFGAEHTTDAIMGKFGNIMFTNGQEHYNLQVSQGDVVRFYVTNVANVRPFNLSFGGAKIKLIGGDLGKFESEQWVKSLVIAPAQRYIIEVLFDAPGKYPLQNRNPHQTYTLGVIQVLPNKNKDLTFGLLHDNPQIRQDIDNYRQYFDKPIDYQIDLTVDIPFIDEHSLDDENEEHTIEWENDMGIINSWYDSSDLTWILEDHQTKQQNKNISMRMKVGDKIKIRLFNDPKSKHPMQHPIHLHGQRFLVLARDEVLEENLVWKDTVLVPIGQTVDILLDATNPGQWMMHCHIAEHLEAGMMASFIVEEN